jgi:sulfopyruvate decarboxylase alpha subunit
LPIKQWLTHQPKHGAVERQPFLLCLPIKSATKMKKIDWHQDIFDILKEENISLVTHVPDAAHAPLIKYCESEDSMDVVTLTTEQDGIGIASGAWAGGRKSVLLMQSSGVGNCINALALPIICRIPFVTIVSMRGEWGEFIPWQVPMGKATPAVLQAMEVQVYRADKPEQVKESAKAALQFAFNTRRSAALLLSQQLIGAKQFKQG